MAEENPAESSINSAIQTTADAAKRLVKEGSKKALGAAANAIIPGSGTLANKALELLSRKGQGGGKDESLKWAAIIGGCFLAFVVLLVTVLIGAFAEIKETAGAIGSKSRDVIYLTKSVSPTKIRNEDLDQTTEFTYTVSIVALKTDLAKISIKKDDFFLTKSNGQSRKITLETTPSLAELNQQLEGLKIAHKDGKNLQFSLSLPDGLDKNELKNSLIFNNIEVEAYIAAGTIPKTVSATAVITIGEWPHCFYFSDEHDSWGSERMAEESALALLMTNSRYKADLCKNPQKPVKLILDKTSLGNECEVVDDSTIIIRNLCLGTPANRFYSLAHESGHVYKRRNTDVFLEFRDLIQPPPQQQLVEPYLCSYRGIKSPSEDFAETIAVYLTKKASLVRDYNACLPSRTISLDDYPLHKQFTQKGYFD